MLGSTIASIHIKYNQYVNTCVNAVYQVLSLASRSWCDNELYYIFHRAFADCLVANSVNNFVPEVHRSVNYKCSFSVKVVCHPAGEVSFTN